MPRGRNIGNPLNPVQEQARALVRHHGTSLGTLGDKAGVTRRTLERWVRREIHLSPETLEAVSQYYRKTVKATLKNLRSKRDRDFGER